MQSYNKLIIFILFFLTCTVQVINYYFFIFIGRGGRNPRNPRKQPTAEELDAELDAYTKEMK